MAVLRNVKVLFSNVNNKDDLSQKYQIVVSMDEEQAADAEEAGVKLKTKEYDGATQYQATFKSKFKPEVLARDGKSIVDLMGGEIGRHSVVNVQYKFRDWKGPSGNTGVGQDLNKIQILEQTEGSGSEFDAVGEDGDTASEF